MNSVVRRVTQMVEKFGCRVEKVSRGKHFKFFLDTPSGKKILVCSVTSSDARAEANNRTLLRNWSRSNG